jgi:hypothetical protein
MKLRSWKALALGTALLVLVTGTVTLGQRWFTQSTPVSSSEALDRFRGGASSTQPVQRPTVQDEASPSPEPDPAPADGTQATRPATETAPAESPVENEVRTEVEDLLPVPEEGVYTYRTEGFERGGFSRDYPSTSQRIITHTSSGTFMNHHIFSRQHEQWFELGLADDGGVMLNRRTRVQFGPVTEDNTIVFEPPMLGVPVPHELGKTWEGSFEGPTSGSYTGRTVDHTTIRVAGEDVEVFANELRIQMRGEVEGEVSITLWASPASGLMIREEAEMNISSGPLTYHSESLIELVSTTPER